MRTDLVGKDDAVGSCGPGRQCGRVPAVRPRDPLTTAPHLTPRQLDVLRLLAEGRSTAEIATELGLRQTTVRNYVANLLAALGAHTRLQAVIAAGKAGLIEP